MISGKYCSLSNYYNNVQLKRPFCYCYYLDNVQSHSPAFFFDPSGPFSLFTLWVYISITPQNPGLPEDRSHNSYSFLCWWDLSPGIWGNNTSCCFLGRRLCFCYSPVATPLIILSLATAAIFKYIFSSF